MLESHFVVQVQSLCFKFYFFVVVIKYPNKNNFSRERTYLSQNCITVKKSRQGSEAAGCIPPVVKSREKMNQCILLLSFLPLL